MKHETIEEAALEFYPLTTTDLICSPRLVRAAFIAGAKWQAERMISQEAYQDSLSLQRASNAGYESKIQELETKIQNLQELTS